MSSSPSIRMIFDLGFGCEGAVTRVSLLEGVSESAMSESSGSSIHPEIGSSTLCLGLWRGLRGGSGGGGGRELA
jgi:hypothetical protein